MTHTTAESSAQYNPDFDRLPAGFKALIEERFAQAAAAGVPNKGRSDAAKERNKKESRTFRDKVAKAAALVSLHDMPKHKRVAAVRGVFLRLGPSHFGLESIPDKETIGSVVDEILEKSAMPEPASRK